MKFKLLPVEKISRQSFLLLGPAQTYLSAKFLAHKTRHHRFDEDVLLLPNLMGFLGPALGVHSALEADVAVGIGRFSAVREGCVWIELHKELLEGIVQVAGEYPALQSSKEGLGDLRGQLCSEIVRGAHLF